MNNEQRLLVEFLFKLIDAQIKKYTKLASIGVGPDARMNAALIQRQVADLLNELNVFLHFDLKSKERTLRLARIVKFYLDCEYLRGRAGWLLDDNKIHNTVYERVSSQQEELADLCTHLPGWSEAAMLESRTSFQQQYLYDSHAISHRILSLAIRLKENPDRSDLGTDNNLGHGLIIMRNHARKDGRYHDKSILLEITQRHEESSRFLQFSGLKKSTFQLDKSSAQVFRQEDEAKFKVSLQEYLKQCPESLLADKEFTWYEVANLTEASSVLPYVQPRRCSSLLKWGLFAAGIATVSTAVIYGTQMMGYSDDDCFSRFGL